MQIIVLGMHRSGTSVVGGILNLMGVYFSPESLIMDADDFNPKGYWERTDVNTLNKEILWSLDAEWDNVGGLDLGKMEIGKADEFTLRAKKIVSRINKEGDWMIKDPRMCLTFPIWKTTLNDPLFVIVYRSPLEVARSLFKRNGIEIPYGLALWEYYYVQILRHTKGGSRIFIDHHDVISNPLRIASQLGENISKSFVEKGTEIREFVDANLHRNRVETQELNLYLTGAQRDLYKCLRDSYMSDQDWELSGISQDLLELRTQSISEKRFYSKQFAVLNESLGEVQKDLNGKLKEYKEQNLDLRKQIEHQHIVFDKLKVECDRLSMTNSELRLNLEYEKEESIRVQKLLMERSAYLERKSVINRELGEEISQLGSELNSVKYRSQHQEDDMARVIHWIDAISMDLKALFNSWSWKIGNGSTSMVSMLLFQQRATAQDHINELFSSYRQWKTGALYKSEQTLRKHCARPIGGSFIKTSTLVDVVICVHNALEDVRECVKSLYDQTNESFHLIMVDDGSESETAYYLQGLAADNRNITLVRNEAPMGYTKAANIGLKVSTSEEIVLLNSDTIVTPMWLTKILKVSRKDARIGIVGPLSNAASWQSVPHLANNDDWSINEPPDDITVDSMSELLTWISPENSIQVPFINGFCFCIRRRLIDAIGYFDESLFSRGYGEENDYCLRAANAGFRLVVATNTYVYHSKSKSYTHSRRRLLSAEGDRKLRVKHGKERIDNHLKEIRNLEPLETVRMRVQSAFDGDYSKDRMATGFSQEFSIGFLLPVGGIGGGIQSIVQEVHGMQKIGVYAHVLTPKEYQKAYQRNYSEAFREGVFRFYHSHDNLLKLSKDYEVMVATTWSTPRLLKRILSVIPDIVPAYYVQDYEPYFFEENSPKWKVAVESYGILPNAILFAKTEWICNEIARLHGKWVHKVKPSLDRSVFFPSTPKGGDVLEIVAMVRLSTPRRSPELTLEVLKIMKEKYKEKINVKVFGCSEGEMTSVSRDFMPKCLGVLSKDEVASLYRESDIFIDLSTYQAFGRTGLEAMACGCAVVLPQKGGVHEYAVNQRNALIVDTSDIKEVLFALDTLITNSELREKIQKSAVQTTSKYSVLSAILSELALLRLESLNVREKRIKLRGLNASVGQNHYDGIKVSAIITRRADGKPTGSANIRLIQPLTHEAICDKLSLKIKRLDQLGDEAEDILVVQRAVLTDPRDVEYVRDYCDWKKVKLVMEIDDNLFSLKRKQDVDVNYSHEQYVALELLARSSDAIITSSLVLRQVLLEYNSNVYYVPNIHDERIWLRKKDGLFESDRRKKEDSKVRILYMGTRTHANDLKIVHEACSRIEREYGDEVQFEIIGGFANGKNTFGTSLIMSGISPEQDAYLEFVKWMRDHNHWDFGIIPLEDNEFNRSKSYIKYLDYSSLGIACICSDIEPYREVIVSGENGLLVKNNTEDWYQAIKLLVENIDFRNKLAANAFTNVIEGHILINRSDLLYEVYKSIMERD